MTDRPVFLLRLQPLPRVDPIAALRAILKTALRRDGMCCLAAVEDTKPQQKESEQ